MSTKKHYTSGVVRRTLADRYPFTVPPSLEISKLQGILSKKEPQCAKYSCSGQVKAALSSIHLLPAICDLGFCKSALVLAGMLESQMFPKVPRTGIFCTLRRKIRQHAADEPKTSNKTRRSSQQAQSRASKPNMPPTSPSTRALPLSTIRRRLQNRLARSRLEKERRLPAG